MERLEKNLTYLNVFFKKMVKKEWNRQNMY